MTSYRRDRWLPFFLLILLASFFLHTLIRVKVVNQSGQELHDLRLIASRTSRDYGTLAPGDSLNFYAWASSDDCVTLWYSPAKKRPQEKDRVAFGYVCFDTGGSWKVTVLPGGEAKIRENFSKREYTTSPQRVPK